MGQVGLPRFQGFSRGRVGVEVVGVGERSWTDVTIWGVGGSRRDLGDLRFTWVPGLGFCEGDSGMRIQLLLTVRCVLG